MNDRKLLELAAKAAGHVGFDFEDGKFWIDGDFGQAGSYPIQWNPLTDDGDALRLATELEFNIFHTGGCAYAIPSDNDSCDEQCVAYRDAGGKHAATRRAIVRAAAAIGKDMP